MWKRAESRSVHSYFILSFLPNCNLSGRSPSIYLCFPFMVRCANGTIKNRGEKKDRLMVRRRQLGAGKGEPDNWRWMNGFWNGRWDGKEKRWRRRGKRNWKANGTDEKSWRICGMDGWKVREKWETGRQKDQNTSITPIWRQKIYRHHNPSIFSNAWWDMNGRNLYSLPKNLL